MDGFFSRTHSLPSLFPNYKRLQQPRRPSLCGEQAGAARRTRHERQQQVEQQKMEQRRRHRRLQQRTSPVNLLLLGQGGGTFSSSSDRPLLHLPLLFRCNVHHRLLRSLCSRPRPRRRRPRRSRLSRTAPEAARTRSLSLLSPGALLGGWAPPRCASRRPTLRTLASGRTGCG